MIPFGPKLLATTDSQTVDIGRAAAAVVVINLSPNLLYVQVGSQATKDFLPPWTGDKFFADSTTNDGNLVVSTSGNTSQSSFIGRVYFPGEAIPGTYPYSVVSQVSLLVTQQTLTNDGANNPTTFIEATAAGEPQSNVTVKNNGNLAISGRDNNIFALLMSIVTSTSAAATIGIGAGTSATTIGGASLEVSASSPFFDQLCRFANGISWGTALATSFKLISNGQLLQVTDGSGNVLTSFGHAGGVTSIQQFEWQAARNGAAQVAFAVAPTDMAAKQWNLQTNTDDTLQWVNATDSKNSLKLKTDGSVAFQNGNTSVLGLGFFTGTGTGTYSHGCGVLPFMVWIEPTGGTLSTHSCGSYTSTQVTVALANSVAFHGVAIG